MNIGLSLSTSLTHKLTPQQVHYLKLLQLTNLQLEQHLQHELEINPMLEESDDIELEESTEQTEDVDELPSDSEDAEQDQTDTASAAEEEAPTFDNQDATNEDENTWQDFIEDESGVAPKFDDDREPVPIKAVTTLVDELLAQFQLISMSDEHRILGEEMIWCIEPNGYLQRSLDEIVDNGNAIILAANLERVQTARMDDDGVPDNSYDFRSNGGRLTGSARPGEAESLALVEESFGRDAVLSAFPAANGYPPSRDQHQSEGSPAQIDVASDTVSGTSSLLALAQKLDVRLLRSVSIEDAEIVLAKIQKLDPPGIGARNLQECLLAQLDALAHLNAAQKLAREVLAREFDAFKMKHFDVILRNLRVNEGYLREALEVIRGLNPKPGGGETTLQTQSIIPDFFVVRDEEEDDFLVYLNDSRMPAVRINQEYDTMRKEARKLKFNKETKDWLRKKFDDANFLIKALQQRRKTMRKVITALVHRQREFFVKGENALKPLIQKDIAEDTALDISTISRVVNGKYVQTEFGVFELKYFFSESLSTDEGEEIATKVIKNKLREMIEREHKKKPLSDQKLTEELKVLGFNVARRTVAKYREQMNIPVARLRKEL